MTDPSPIAISFRRVGKHYRLLRRQNYLAHDLLRLLLRRGIHTQKFWALRDISFEVPAGQAVAFMGGNGAGKSTLLGLTAGTVFPSTGQIRVRGRIGALLELGAGFHPDLTGRENIFLNASLLGMQREEVEARYARIAEFSELEEFIDAPLRTYSSGMQVRLGFSVAVHIDPTILIMDEVLAVGDQHFQKKCIRRIEEFRAANRTLLFVSHSAESVGALCDRMIWLDHGRIRADGPVKDLLDPYQAAMQ